MTPPPPEVELHCCLLPSPFSSMAQAQLCNVLGVHHGHRKHHLTRTSDFQLQRRLYFALWLASF